MEKTIFRNLFCLFSPKPRCFSTAWLSDTGFCFFGKSSLCTYYIAVLKNYLAFIAPKNCFNSLFIHNFFIYSPFLAYIRFCFFSRYDKVYKPVSCFFQICTLVHHNAQISPQQIRTFYHAQLSTAFLICFRNFGRIFPRPSVSPVSCRHALRRGCRERTLKSRYLLGGMPTIFENIWLNRLGSSYPTTLAIYVTLQSVLVSSDCASPTRLRVRYCIREQ